MTTVEADQTQQYLTSPEEYTKAILNILEDFMGEKERLENSQRAMLNLLDDFDAEKERLVGTQRAAINILEDFSEEKKRLEDSQRAMLNLLDDFNAEKERLVGTQRAAINILEDFSEEKSQLEDSQRAMLNLLDDFDTEKERLVQMQRAAFNILEDFSEEKKRLEDIQRATMNLLDDFDVERAKVEAAHHELQSSFKSLRAAKEAADAYNREIESFSYSVSHDLRTPLRSIAGFSQVLVDEYANNLDQRGRGFLSRIIAAATKMGLLIDDLLNLSRVTRTEMTREQVDLTEAARRTTRGLVESSPERQVEFRIADGLIADCDERLILIVLQNLLGNAWKFTQKSEHAVIEFGVSTETDQALYFVRDNGAGFDMAFAGKLFNPFQRVHKAEDFPGTGVGLATVKRIIERHGGRIWMEGSIGKGATVYFTLE